MTLQDAPLDPGALPGVKPPRTWKFWGTSLWGLFAFAALFLGQVTVVLYLIVIKDAPFDLALLTRTLSSGTAIALSVIMGLPAVCAALWLATRLARIPFADYLALRGTGWKNYALGALGLILLVGLWELISRATGRDSTPGFMLEVLKSARADGALWLLVIAFCVAAPLTEEFFVRGFLYRGWSESFLRPWGAIVLSSLVWTAMHLQYDWFFFCEIFTIGLLLGWLRYRFHSTWLTVFLHGLNNLAATVQTLWLAMHS
ncbi:CPBP family intramembrane glutamic endopeptidase [Tardiphaga sp.]|uniref:CPBP family intramembrane glutamic endopeptidase n=1 Tax=Tardiphaga sp. TaxID=1926292 RepID=UPI00262293AC|nr:CPBP family intramembrane glutamic endopeptidase [Tardiphaga sp.]MDB5619084.1 Abortive infection protein [Tardiphaga sp.]